MDLKEKLEQNKCMFLLEQVFMVTEQYTLRQNMTQANNLRLKPNLKCKIEQ